MPEFHGKPRPVGASATRRSSLVPPGIALIFRRYRAPLALGVIAGIAIALGVIGLYIVAPSRIAPLTRGSSGMNSQLANKAVGETAWKDVPPYEETGPTSTVLIGLGVGLLSYVVAEGIGMFVKQKLRSESESKFEKFFGSGSLSRGVRGRIILQADTFQGLVEGLTGKDSEATRTVVAALNQPKNNRLFKGRKLVNARDVESAKIVREELRKQMFPTPELTIIDRPIPGEEGRDPFVDFASAPYIISMGLGFTETTLALAHKVGNQSRWIYIDKATDRGDAIVISDRFLMQRYTNLEIEKVVMGKDENGKDKVYFRFFPENWRLDDWLAGSADLRDYAVIMRHTETVGRSKQVRFILAGFTEDATVAASRYFASRWDTTLWKLSKTSPAAPAGDFVAIITGLSTSSAVWTEEPDPAYSIPSVF